MGDFGEVQLNIRGPPGPTSSPKDDALLRSGIRNWAWWLVVLLCVLAVLAGQTVATILGRIYYDKGGSSMWMSTMVQSAGSPLLLIPLLLIPSPSIPNPVPRPPVANIVLIYTALGLIIAGDNLMYSYGLLYLPVSTYSLVCATQLAFNVVFAYFLNAQKFTALIFNSVVLLTFSAALLGVRADSEDSANIPKGKYPIGYVLTLGASAVFSLLLSLFQLTFEKVLKRENFSVVLEVQMCTNLVATTATVVGLFASGEWRGLTKEMQGFETGRVSYVMTLVGIAVCWQVASVGAVALILIMSSLFSNVISTLALPVVPIFAMVFLHDKMDGVKVVSMLIAVWGFLSYIYQHYLDDLKAKRVEGGVP